MMCISLTHTALSVLVIALQHQNVASRIIVRQVTSSALFAGSFCDYTSFQAAIVNDELFMYGGNITLEKGNSSVGKREVESGYQFFSINLNSTFKTSDNISNFVSREPDPSAAKAVANIKDGTAYSFQKQMYFYGGNQFTDAANESTTFQCSPKDDDHYVWDNNEVNNGVTRSVAKGASAMAASENKGFYFAGQPIIPKGASSTSDSYGNVNASMPNLIVAQFSENGTQTWNNITARNPDIQAYNQGNLVFIPAGKEGILVVIGGESPTGDGAWTSLPVFDIATANWYTQSTNGSLAMGTSSDPGPQTCNVVISAPDNSYHNVYIYGGANRANTNAQLAILTIPAFQWTVISNPAYTPKVGAQCTLVGDRQMLILGGSTGASGTEDCGSNTFVEIMDLSTLLVVTNYPDSSSYTPPSIVGNYTTMATPVTGWNNPQASSAYDIIYQTLAQRNAPTKSSNTGAIVGGIVGGIGGALILAATAFFIYRHYMKSKRKGAIHPSFIGLPSSNPQPNSLPLFDQYGRPVSEMYSPTFPPTHYDAMNEKAEDGAINDIPHAATELSTSYLPNELNSEELIRHELQ